MQFFGDEQSLGETVAHFLGSGLVDGEAVLVIATPAHRRRFHDRLTASSFDLERAESTGLYSELDAHDTLARFMEDGMPVPARFHEVVGGRVALLQRLRPGTRLRAYGEMVDLLWREGNHAGALALEALWNEVCQRESLTLLCAYSVEHFDGDAGRAAIEQVRATHTHEIPHAAQALPPEATGQLREMTLLQQRASELAHEIARREALEDELRETLRSTTEARSEAERTVRFNELFAGMLGHDLRNPLNAVSTTAHYLARLSRDPKVLTAANRILSSSDRMARMIEQLLDFTRVRVGNGLPLHRSHADLVPLCDAIKGELETANAGREIVVSARGDTSGDLDTDRIQQVLSNVMANAVHHGTPGSVVHVDVDGTEPATLSIAVHNDGAVSPEVAPVLFEPFRAVGRGPRTQGLGLGLYLTRQLVLAHGGTIAVASGEPEGTTIRVRMPRTATQEGGGLCLQH